MVFTKIIRLWYFQIEVVLSSVISLAGTTFWYDMMMLRKEEKDIMLEDTYEAGTMKKSSSKKMKGH